MADVVVPTEAFVALIADVVKSSEIPDRLSFQSFLEVAIQRANARFRSVVTSRFVVTLGDEFQALLSGPEALFEIVDLFEANLPGVQLRYGIGLGRLSTALKPDAVGMDGPCFHMARDAVTQAKRETASIVVHGIDDSWSQWVNATLGLISALRGRRTELMRQTVYEAKYGEGGQRGVAQRRGVDESTVSKCLQAACYRTVCRGEDAAISMMVECFRRLSD